MKKGLSVLLIAAALFGFYGGAVNLNDVLACKDYWEVKGEETTADLNKLEDGLNQLKDNEEAYLDGLVAVEDGEKALAKGKQDLAAGKAELAKGEADYAAGKAKLDANTAAYLAGKKTLAENETAYIAGKKTLAENEGVYLAGKRTLAENETAYIAGKKTLAEKKAQYVAGKKTLSDKKAQYVAGKKTLSEKRGQYVTGKKLLDENKAAYAEGKKSADALTSLRKSLSSANKKYINEFRPGLEQLEKGKETIKKLFTSKADDLKLIEGLLGIENGSIVSSLKDAENVNDFYDALKDVDKTFTDAQNAMAQKVPTLTSTATDLSSASSNITSALDEMDKLDAKISALEAIPEDERTEEQKTALEQLKNGKKQYESGVSNGRSEVVRKANAFNKEYGSMISLLESSSDPQISGAAMLAKQQMGLILNSGTSDSTFADACKTLSGTLSGVVAMLNEKAEELKGYQGQFTSYYDGFEGLVEGQAAFSGSTSSEPGLPFAFKSVLANKSLADRIKDASASLHSGLKTYSMLPLDSMDLETFNTHMTVISTQIIPGLIQTVNTVMSSISEYEDGMAQVAAYEDGMAQVAAYEDGMAQVAAYEDGMAQVAAYEDGMAQVAEYENGMAQIAEYEDGLAKIAEYEAGERELAAGAAKLADGRRKLAEGIQQLEDGRKELADGKDKLAEYEDGEQQVRDGLATLVATEPDGGLTSILERLDGKDKFDDPNGHLELDEGLNAVTVGREYQSDSGELITEEITKRAIGTAAGFGAAALAVLAAILSFLKKNKGAGVTAILSAVAGAVGVGVGTSAGMEFSHIAGSTVSSMPWIAAGILAAVAVAHAITHFAGSKAA